MARRSDRSDRDERDTPAISNQRLLLPLLDFTTIPPSDLLRSIEDRRTFYPERATRPASSYSRPRHRLESAPGYNILPFGVRFEEPRKVLVCVRRKQRREVLFALKRTGRGAGKKRHKRSMYSDVRC